MQDRGARTGLATLCLGGGDAVAHERRADRAGWPQWMSGSPCRRGADGQWHRAHVRPAWLRRHPDRRLVRTHSHALARRSRSNLDRQIKKGTIDAAAKDATLSPHHRAHHVSMRPRTPRSSSRRRLRTPRSSSSSSPSSIAWRRQQSILASNTSSISITEIAAHTQRPDHVIGMHFMNPVPVMELVEVIRGLATSDATTATITALANARRQDAGRGPGLSGLRRQPRAHADDQRGGVLRDGGRGDA